jgi:hypothetical protein
MSTDNRFDPLGLAELDAAFAPVSAFPGAADEPAAQDAFAEMKQLFVQAVENMAHRKAAWLRSQVRAAEDPIDLWLLRGPLLAALREDDRGTRPLRAAIYKSLDRAFPDAFGMPVAAAGVHRFAI